MLPIAVLPVAGLLLVWDSPTCWTSNGSQTPEEQSLLTFRWFSPSASPRALRREPRRSRSGLA